MKNSINAAGGGVAATALARRQTPWQKRIRQQQHAAQSSDKSWRVAAWRLRISGRRRGARQLEHKTAGAAT
jgi:hypothetical protein